MYLQHVNFLILKHTEKTSCLQQGISPANIEHTAEKAGHFLWATFDSLRGQYWETLGTHTTLSGLQSMLEMGWDASVAFCSSDREPITPSSLPASSDFTLLCGYVLCGQTRGEHQSDHRESITETVCTQCTSQPQQRQYFPCSKPGATTTNTSELLEGPTMGSQLSNETKAR